MTTTARVRRSGSRSRRTTGRTPTAAASSFSTARRRRKIAAMSDPYAAFPSLTFDRPAPRVMRITLDGPGLNAVGPALHRELADVWLAVDRSEERRVGKECR